jgi:hypothetical protein
MLLCCDFKSTLSRVKSLPGAVAVADAAHLLAAPAGSGVGIHSALGAGAVSAGLVQLCCWQLVLANGLWVSSIVDPKELQVVVMVAVVGALGSVVCFVFFVCLELHMGAPNMHAPSRHDMTARRHTQHLWTLEQRTTVQCAQ